MYALLLTACALTGGSELEAPFRVQAGGSWIDVEIGHAAPLWCDWNGDGLGDLLVGQFGEGKLRIYENVGQKGAPAFGNFGLFAGKVPTG